MMTAKAMSIRLSLTALVAALTLAVFTAGAQAQNSATPPDPQAIADHTIEQATQIATDVGERMQANADQAVNRIAQLLADNQVRQAKLVAARNIREIRAGAHLGLDRIARVCHRGVQGILRTGGDEALVEEVRSACREQADAVRDAAQAAIQSIKDALPDPSTDE
jgi:hypothetical protein